MRINEKTIFLIDGVGACASAVFTGLVLPHFSEWIGLPTWILYSLALLGLVYGVYSLSCYGFVNRTKPLMLLAIICANLCYCMIGFGLAAFFSGVTNWGRAYFVGEILIILGIVALETSIYRKLSY